MTESGIMSEQKLRDLFREADELTPIFVASAKTAKREFDEAPCSQSVARTSLLFIIHHSLFIVLKTTMTSKQIMDRLHGIIPPMATPFNRKGDVDEGAFRANLERYVGTGLAGVMVAGTTGEGPLLKSEERLRLTALTRKAVRPTELVITGTGLESTRETIHLSQEAIKRGADAVLVLSPWYYKGKMDGLALLAHYRAVADALPRPLLIYSIPQCTGVRIPPETVAALARHPNIAGIKESSGDLAYVRSFARRVPARFRVFCGSLQILPDVLRAGGAGGILSQADFVPELCVAFYEAFRQGRRKVARELYGRLLPLATEITLKHGVAGVKAAMDVMGYHGGSPRGPLLPVSEAARRAIARTLELSRSSLAY
jgi:4-hydroxy-2-oxoglutarate aldolase